MPNKWSSQQRAEMARHVAFEMAAMRAGLANYRAKNDAFAAEAFLLHARVLAEFSENTEFTVELDDGTVRTMTLDPADLE